MLTELEAPRKGFGMSFLKTIECDLEGAREQEKETLQDGRRIYEVFVCATSAMGPERVPMKNSSWPTRPLELSEHRREAHARNC